MTVDKQSVFLDAIRKRSQAEIKALTDGEDERRSAVEKDARDRAAEEAKRWLDEQSAKAAAEGKLRLEAKAAADRRALLEYREKCAQEAFDEARARITAFAASPDYPGRLAELLKKTLDTLGRGAPVTVYLRKEDLPLAETLRAGEKSAALTFAEGDFALGGLVAAVPSEGKRADQSFDTSLRDLRGQFAELSGLEIE